MMQIKGAFLGALMALILMAALPGCGGSSKAQEAEDAVASAAADAAAAAAGGYVLSIEAGQHIGDEVTVRGSIKDYSLLMGREGQPVILIFDVPGIVTRGSGISDLETPQSFKVIVWKKDATNFPTNFAVSYVGKTVCVTGMVETYRGDATIAVQDPSQIVVGC